MYPTQAKSSRIATTNRALANRIRILRWPSLGGLEPNLVSVQQCLVQVEQGMEVGPLVALLLAQEVGIDQVEDDLADVVGLVDPPPAEDDAGHATELALGQVDGPRAQFLAGHVVLGRGGLAGRFGRPAAHLLGMSVRLEQELVRLIGIP